MQAEHLEKIKVLIANSKILSAPEKSEWLTLLDLMDDKQLSELEKILSSALPPLVQAPKITEHKIEPAAQIKPAPVQAAVKPTGPLPGSIPTPKLSHIVNLPKAFGAAAAPKTQAAPKLPEKKDSGFLARLKSILAEKELPAGHPEPDHAKALPGPEAKKVEPAKPAPVVPRPMFKEKVLEAPVLPKPAAVRPPIASPSPKPNSAPVQGVKNKEGGLAAFAQTSQKEKESIISKIKQDVVEKKLVQQSVEEAEKDAEPEYIKRTGKSAAITKLEDLAGLSVQGMRDADFRSMVKSIRELIDRTGYHTVLFSLEQSDLYKNYIKTGQDLLNSQNSFEQLQSKNPAYLTRADFEEFIDLLRQIQAS